MKAIAKHLMLYCILLLSIYSCAGVSSVYYDMDNNQVMVQRTISDPHALTTSQQRSWLEVCTKIKDGVDVYGNQLYRLSMCTRNSDIQFTATSGYIAGITGPLLYSGAAIGASYFIGKGIGDSAARNTTSMSQTGANNTSNQTGANNTSTMTGANNTSTLTGANNTSTMTGANNTSTMTGANNTSTLTGANSTNNLTGANSTNTNNVCGGATSC